MSDIWGELAGEDPVQAMVTAGVLPLDWPGIGAVLAALGWFKNAADPGEAAKKAFARDGGMKAALIQARRAASKGGRNSPIVSVGVAGRFRGGGPWPSYAYRRSGRRRAGTALIALDHADPKAALSALVGPLQMFERTVQQANNPACEPPAPEMPALPNAPAHAADLAVILDASSNIDSVKVGLPPVLNALVARGTLLPAARQRSLDRFRRDRGPLPERERRELARLAAEVGAAALIAAGQAAARAKVSAAG